MNAELKDWLDDTLYLICWIALIFTFEQPFRWIVGGALFLLILFIQIDKYSKKEKKE